MGGHHQFSFPLLDESTTRRRTHPNRKRLAKLFGVQAPGVPLNVLSLTPPQSSPPRPCSQSRTARQASSLTALWIGTSVFMSPAFGRCCLRSIAAKNWDSDG